MVGLLLGYRWILCKQNEHGNAFAVVMAYYFKSKHAELLAEGSGVVPEALPGVRTWAELREELLATPVAMRAVYGFLAPGEKLPHCAVCKRFRADIGAAPLDVSGSEVPRFLRAVVAHAESTQYRACEALGMRGTVDVPVAPSTVASLAACVRAGRFAGLKSIVLEHMSPLDPAAADEDPLASVASAAAASAAVERAKAAAAEAADGAAGPLLKALHGGACHALTRLSLANCALGQRGIECLARFLWARQCPLLQALVVSNNGAGIFGAKKLCASLRMLERLRELDMGYNDAQDMGAVALCGVLRFLDNLECLSFSGNHCGVEGGRQLGKMVEGGYLERCRTLRLESNADDPGFTAEVCATLRAGECAALERLELGGNGMSKAGVRALAEALATRCCPTLRALGVARNGLGPVGVRQLSGALVGLPALKELDLCGNYAGAGALDFLQCLRRGACRGIEVLKISGNRLGDTGFKLLGEVVSAPGACRVVRELWASDNESGDEGMVEFAPCLYVAGRTLSVLDLSFNRIGSNGLLRLADGLGDEVTRSPNCPALQWLNLAGLADTEYEWAIHEKVKNFVCPSLTALNISLDGTLHGGTAYLRELLAKPPRAERRQQLMEKRRARLEQERAEKRERQARERQEARRAAEKKRQQQQAAALLRREALEAMRRATEGGEGGEGGAEAPHQRRARLRRWARDEQRRDHAVERGRLRLQHAADRKRVGAGAGEGLDPAAVQELGRAGAAAAALRTLGDAQQRASALAVTRQKQQRDDLADTQLAAVRGERAENERLDAKREAQRMRVKRYMKEQGL
eukprot:g2.t1